MKPVGSKSVSVGRINYMNDAPVYYGLEIDPLPAWLKIVSGPPALLNGLLDSESLDISPISSVAYASHQKEWFLLPDISISCFGSVMSVLLISKLPLEELSGQPLLLTEESATGAALLKLLLSWKKIQPVFKTGKIVNAKTFDHHFQGALVIGDAALTGKWSEQFSHVWDLGEMWRTITGLPFVFALWAVRKQFAEENPQVVATVIKLLADSKAKGQANIQDIATFAAGKLNLKVDLIRNYYELLRFDLGLLQRKGLETFFDGLYRAQVIRSPVQLNFFSSSD